jgi:hypothetical protein
MIMNKGFTHFDLGFPLWCGFSWRGELILKCKDNKGQIKVKATGIYVNNGNDMEFKIINLPDWLNVNDFEVYAWKTDKDKENKLFTTININ